MNRTILDPNLGAHRLIVGASQACFGFAKRCFARARNNVIFPANVSKYVLLSNFNVKSAVHCPPPKKKKLASKSETLITPIHLAKYFASHTDVQQHGIKKTLKTDDHCDVIAQTATGLRRVIEITKKVNDVIVLTLYKTYEL